MHGVLAFVAGVFVTIAVVLIVLALSGITYYGITTQGLLALAVVALALAALSAWIIFYALKSRTLKIQTGKEALIGSAGKATTELNPNGTVRVKGEFWEATTKNPPINAGENIKVVCMEGMFLIVEPVEEKALTPKCKDTTS